MVWTRHVLSALTIAASFAATAGADVSSAKPNPRLDAVFKSLQDSTQGDGISIPVLPVMMIAVAAVMMTVAIKQWNRRRANPRPLSSHRKLLKEAARAAGVSQRKLKRIAPLAQADGLSSPLVAIICPSAIKRLAKVVRTADEQEALKSMAEALFRAEGRPRNAR
jgi:hypothetical protein